MDRSIRRSTVPLVCIATSLVMLACEGQAPPQGTADTTPGPAERHDLPLPSPSSLTTSRAVDRDALGVTVLANRQPARVVRDESGTWTAEVRVPRGERASVSITWFERIGDVPLPLTAHTFELGPLDADRTIEIDPDRYDGGAFDRDGDGVSNLDEREADTDPFRTPGDERPAAEENDNSEDPLASPPGADDVIDVVILPLTETSGRPALDGLYDDPIWTRNVSSRNVDRQLLFVNRLVADATPGTGEEPRGYQWLAMHDFTYLYLYVVFERGNRRTDAVDPFRDSGESFRDDDMLTLYFDADHGRTDAPDGTDDRQVVIPFVRANGEPGQPEAFSPDPVSGALVPNVDFAACVCEDEVESAWEIRIPTAALGIGFDRPFGFEIRLDQDEDGGPSESSWAWASPTLTERDEGIPDGSPSLYGTVVLSSTR